MARALLGNCPLNTSRPNTRKAIIEVWLKQSHGKHSPTIIEAVFCVIGAEVI
jgi:hypothetical protein